MSERILVVDDDRDFAESIAMRCRKAGYEAQIAVTPLDAVGQLVDHPPDLLCLDVNLPTANGLDLCEFLVREGAAPQMPVIVLTGQTDRETVFRAVSLRTHYVHKSPDVWRRLAPMLEELLPSPAA